jgi:hypothetical protein
MQIRTDVHTSLSTTVYPTNPSRDEDVDPHLSRKHHRSRDRRSGIQFGIETSRQVPSGKLDGFGVHRRVGETSQLSVGETDVNFSLNEGDRSGDGGLFPNERFNGQGTIVVCRMGHACPLKGSATA